MIADNYLSSASASQKLSAIESKYSLPSGTLKQVYNPLLVSMLSSYIAAESVLPELPEIPELPDTTDPSDKTEQGSGETTESTADPTGEHEGTTEPVATEPPVPEVTQPEEPTVAEEPSLEMLSGSRTGEF